MHQASGEKDAMLIRHYLPPTITKYLNDHEINLIVELIDDADEAFKIVSSIH